jgi:thioredoxin-dependent peroxiredoxin
MLGLQGRVGHLLNCGASSCSLSLPPFIFARFGLKQNHKHVTPKKEYPMPDLQPGDLAPAISLPRDGGGTTSLSDFAGKPVVVYFYPKDDTPGCTLEAQSFTSAVEAFADSGAVVLGVSKDSVQKHDKFRAKYGLRIALLSDEAGDVCERYGVWAEKSMYGKTYMGIERATFLIDGAGKIARVWRKVKVEGHTDDVLIAVQAL